MRFCNPEGVPLGRKFTNLGEIDLQATMPIRSDKRRSFKSIVAEFENLQ